MGASLTRITALRALFSACLPGYDALKILFAWHHSGSHPGPSGSMPGMPGFHMWKTQRSEYLLGG
jgi:hypothetical protein